MNLAAAAAFVASAGVGAESLPRPWQQQRKNWPDVPLMHFSTSVNSQSRGVRWYRTGWEDLQWTTLVLRHSSLTLPFHLGRLQNKWPVTVVNHKTGLHTEATSLPVCSKGYSMAHITIRQTIEKTIRQTIRQTIGKTIEQSNRTDHQAYPKTDYRTDHRTDCRRDPRTDHRWC